MSVDVLVITTLLASGTSAVYGFSRSIRKDVLPALLAHYRKSSALITSLVVDLLILALVVVGLSVGRLVTSQFLTSVSGDPFLEMAERTMGTIFEILMFALVLIHFLAQSYGLLTESLKNSRH